MRITIGDLDYYFAADKKNKINVNVQKLSSYHKQKGDQINFVLTKYDINRPYDIYYIFKENINTPNPPLEFFTNSKVKGCGKAFQIRSNGKMTDTILACRPDYLLYPNRDTRLERAERIRLIGNNNTVLPITQDGSNTFKDKYYIVEDTNLWYCSEEVILEALDRIKDVNNISFEAPIWIEKFIKCPRIQKKFGELKLSTRSQITWMPIKIKAAEEMLKGIVQFRAHFPNCPIKTLEIASAAAADKEQALLDFESLKKIIIFAKQEKILVKITAPKRNKTPFFFLFELVENWCEMNIKLSWLEFLSSRYAVGKNIMSGVTDGNKPQKGPILFRDALRQTYQDREFLLLRGGDDKISELEVPWILGDEEFKYGI